MLRGGRRRPRAALHSRGRRAAAGGCVPLPPAAVGSRAPRGSEPPPLGPLFPENRAAAAGAKRACAWRAFGPPARWSLAEPGPSQSSGAALVLPRGLGAGLAGRHAQGLRKRYLAPARRHLGLR